MGNNNATSLKEEEEEENKAVESQPEKALQDHVHEDEEKVVINPVPTDEIITNHEKSADHNLTNSDSALITNEDNNTLLSTKEKAQILPSDEGGNQEAETSPAFESEDIVNGEKIENGSIEHFDTEGSAAFRVVPDNQETETFLSPKSCDLLGPTMICPEKLDGYGTEEGESEVPQEPNSIFHNCTENEEQKETEMLSNSTAAADTVLSETDQESGSERPRDEELLLEEAELAASESMGKANEHNKYESGVLDGTELQKEPKKEEPNQPPLESIIGLDSISNEGTILESNECLHKEESFQAVGDEISETPKAYPSVTMETDDETEEPAAGQLMSVESDTESITTTNSQMQKSPSFHLDQTSFLYREDDGVESSPEEADQEKSLEGKTPFLGFMSEVEEKPNTINVTAEEQDHHQHQREDIKENISTKGKEKWRLRSSLFGTCICCGTVMNQTVS